jgi:hypothetical protein
MRQDGNEAGDTMTIMTESDFAQLLHEIAVALGLTNGLPGWSEWSYYAASGEW